MVETGSVTDGMSSPRALIKNAVHWQLVDETDGYLWLEALEARNELVHIYKEELALRNEDTIHSKYYPLA